MKIETDAGGLSIQLRVSNSGKGLENAAVAEIVGRGTNRSKITLPIGVNAAPKRVPLEPGDYTVRLFLPSGEVLAESVSVGGAEGGNVDFDMVPPQDWLSLNSVLGAVQRLPSVERARNLEAWRMSDSAAESLEATGASGRVSQAISDFNTGLASLERISGADRTKSMKASCRYAKVDPSRPLPEGRISTEALARWWAGEPEPGAPIALQITQSDDRNAKLTLPHALGPDRALIDGSRRMYASIQDPTGEWHYAVYPAGWVCVSGSNDDSKAQVELLMTVVIDSVMRGNAEAAGEVARWRCTPLVTDVQAMAYLGFLHSGQASAAEAMLAQALELLFEKGMNPVGASAGAFGLLAFSPESSSRRASWRSWIRNLYSRFPRLPDAAIAMAQMYLRFGDGESSDDELDIEKLRTYALDAVRRGLPYLAYGIQPLSEILLLLVTDDQQHERSSPQVEDTRRARRMVQQLERLMTPGTFFTVLETGETAP